MVNIFLVGRKYTLRKSKDMQLVLRDTNNTLKNIFFEIGGN